MKKSLHLVFVVLLLWDYSYGQINGGDQVYEFLNLSPSARVTALAGTLVSVRDDDVALAQQNPAVLNPTMHQQLSVNHVLYLADIQHGYASYAHYLKKWEVSTHVGIQYLSYGEFKETDETGQVIGSFRANEYALTLGAGKQLYEKLAVGANLKVISSQLETYNSTGMAIDLGAYYQDTSGLFSMGLVLKNAGAQFTKYGDTRESLPFDMQLGISQKLRHLPFRITITYHNLHRWNILYDDPNSEEDVFLLGDNQPQERSRLSEITDNFFRHLNFSGEFLLGKKENFRIRLGYSHLRRKELAVDNFRSLGGFSGGIGVKINRFRIEYGHAFYHFAGGTDHFSISTDLGSFRR